MNRVTVVLLTNEDDEGDMPIDLCLREALTKGSAYPPISVAIGERIVSIAVEPDA
jgi:hypothetical protein